MQYFNKMSKQKLGSEAESSGNELVISKWRITVCMCAPTFLSAILSCVCVLSFLLNCSGKTLSVLHTKPHTSPSLSLSFLLPQAAVFLSWPGNWSQAVFPYPCLTSRNSQTYRNTHTYSSCLSLPCPTLVWLLTVCWPHFGLETEEQLFPLFCLAAVIACSHCSVRAAWLLVEMLSW